MDETLDVKVDRLQLDRFELWKKIREKIGPTKNRELEVLIERYGGIQRELGETWLLTRIMRNEGVATH